LSDTDPARSFPRSGLFHARDTGCTTGRIGGRSSEYAAVVDRICPFLALTADHRTAVDGYDPDHACHARRPPAELDRVRQAEVCLAEAHRQCEFYVAYLSEHAAGPAIMPLPAADTHVARTRLVIEQEPRRLASAAQAPFGASPRRWLAAGGIAAAGVAVAATAVAGGFNGLIGQPAASSAAAQPDASDSGTPSQALPTAEPTPRATAVPTPERTARPTASAKPDRTPVATPEPQTYVVQVGDTLSNIAARYGTTVAALQAANNLGDSDVINIGQLLVIP
jgi:LysM repeat protein